MTIKPSGRFRAAGLMILAAAALAFSAAPAHALVVNKVKKCKTISKSGFYQLTQDLVFAGPDVCLRITGNKVILNFNGFNVTGSGAGIGILITGKNAFIDMDDGTVSDFAIGIEDDADNAVVENFALLNNSDSGLYVNGANGGTFGGGGINNNNNHGIHLRRANHNVFHNFGDGTNGKLGVWAEQSSNNVFNNFVSKSNGIAGVYFGCSATGPIGPGCAGSNSGSNVVLSTGVDNNGAYGIAIDFDSQANVISGAEESKNPTADAYDGNVLCGTNLWFNQNHITSNEPTCTNE